jgi:transcriptional regulator with XRE-family HTH domain
MNKLSEFDPVVHRLIGIACGGEMQGLMRLTKTGHNARLGPDAGKLLVYVEFLESSPWNTRLFTALGNPGISGNDVGNSGGSLERGRTTMSTTSTANDWFRKAAEIEAEHDITIGSRPPKAPQVSPCQAGGLGAIALGKLVELRRRERALSVDRLAAAAGVSLGNVVRIERGLVDGLSITVIEAIAGAQDLPAQNLTELVEHRSQTGTPLEEAAAQFAARVTEAESLRSAESCALSEFVRVIVGC